MELTGENPDPDGMAIRAELAGKIGRTSVPAIFVAGEFIGGCNDGGAGGLMPLSRSGDLDKFLEKCSPQVRKA
ncbi:hypothetical protein PPROV_000284500 [Pycnococcus provasolii]|uniref:Glutaredoxin domain-containing protein n=1 Tax=Pycnococcus provasolii TaxID=41880 RepID=A0A830HER7_9CHLO|nr:hypothetical protein PPROV_000284500 [Pycnococcus provasolii]